MSKANSMDRRVGLWRTHEVRGWVCRSCGHHAKGTTSRLVHERRADRGIGCSSNTQHNARIQPETPAQQE